MELGKTPSSTRLVDPVTFLQECDKGLVETLGLYGRRFVGVLDPHRCVRDYGLTSVSECIKFIKNFVSFWIPYSLGDDLPPGMQVVPYSLMTIHARSFFQNTFGSGGRSGKRIIRLAGVIAYSKRLFPSVPQSFVDEKLRAYGESLSRRDPLHFPFRSALESAIDREVDMISTSFLADYTIPFAPSVSSCVENTKSQGGVQSLVRDFLRNDPLSRGSSWTVEEEEILEKDFGSIGSCARIDDLEKKLRHVPGNKLKPFIHGIWDEVISYLLNRARSDVLTARQERGALFRERALPVGLLEPLKVRIITRQSWYLNLLKPVQKSWHDALRRIPTYQLVGGQDVLTALNELSPLKKGERYMSGDYEAATDNIYLWATHACLASLLKRTKFKFGPGLLWLQEEMSSFLVELCFSSFENLSVQLPDKTVLDLHRGQMMGNILSFPILCIINGAATRLALGGSSEFRINGDDVACKATVSQYRRWKFITSCVGLKFSLGKNYFSNKFWMINSQYFVYSKELQRLDRVIIPNVGLLNSSSLLDLDRETGREILPLETISSLWKDFELTLLDDKMKRRGLLLFRSHYQKFLSDFPGSLFGPRILGCLGATVPEGYVFTRMERIWMEAHRLGNFNYQEGRTTEYSRISSCCQNYTSKMGRPFGLTFSDALVVGPPKSKYFDFSSQRSLIIPDPFSRGGGFENSLMPVVRWFTACTSKSAARVHLWRRWRRFLLKSKTQPILSSDISNSELNRWQGKRRSWHTGVCVIE